MTVVFSHTVCGFSYFDSWSMYELVSCLERDLRGSRNLLCRLTCVKRKYIASYFTACEQLYLPCLVKA